MPYSAPSACLDCGRATTGTRCRACRATSPRNHGGVPRQQRGHGADYQRVRATLIGRPCHWCGKRADTADYAVPWSRGGTLVDLVPACRACNYSRGGRLNAGVRS